MLVLHQFPYQLAYTKLGFPGRMIINQILELEVKPLLQLQISKAKWLLTKMMFIIFYISYCENALIFLSKVWINDNHHIEKLSSNTFRYVNKSQVRYVLQFNFKYYLPKINDKANPEV